MQLVLCEISLDHMFDLLSKKSKSVDLAIEATVVI